MQRITVKRVYDTYASSDGTRILIDRLWPRGVKKADAHIDIWAKDLAPSNALRTWFHKDPAGRFKEFRERYQKELKAQKADAKAMLDGIKKKKVTLVTAVKDPERSHASELLRFLKSL